MNHLVDISGIIYEKEESMLIRRLHLVQNTSMFLYVSSLGGGGRGLSWYSYFSLLPFLVSSTISYSGWDSSLFLAQR